MVKCLDDNIGRLFQVLEANGKLDSTIIMMTSDHGDLCYEHDRLNKGNPYEGSARVPMLIRFPDSLSAGLVYEQPVGTVDITPTLLRLAGNNFSAGDFQGRDLSEAFRRGVSKETTHTFLRNAGTKASWICVVDSRYKLVLSVNDRPWLFDSQQDPDELHNFFGRPGSEAVTRALAKALKSYSIESGDAFAKQLTIAKSLNLCLQVGLVSDFLLSHMQVFVQCATLGEPTAVSCCHQSKKSHLSQCGDRTMYRCTLATCLLFFQDYIWNHSSSNVVLRSRML